MNPNSPRPCATRHPDLAPDGECGFCRAARHDPRYAGWRPDGFTPPAPAGPGRPAEAPPPPAPCKHFGDEVRGPERQRLGLAHAKRWHRCAAGRGDQVPGYVCPCGECKGCTSYAPASEPPAPVRAPAPPFEWVSTARLAADTVRLSSLLPPEAAAVAGVPRSGMIPASILATHLHLPLYQLTEEGQLQRLGNGSRGRTWRFADGPGPVVVVDDTVYGGNAMARARKAMAALGRPAVFAAVYVRPEASSAVDVFARALPSPHLLEWNWANNGPIAGDAANPVYGRGVACDFDGVLCHDPDVPDADGGPGLEAYRRWIARARPLWLPRTNPVPLICTARLERFRPETEAWLRRWGVRWQRLVMHPAAVASERNRPGVVAAYKARHFVESGCGFFIESDPGQAAEIHRLTGRPVICPAAGRVFQ